MKNKYAQPVQRMTEDGKTRAIYEAEIFGRDVGYAFMGLYKDKYGYSADLFQYPPYQNSNDEYEASASIVRCPYCNAIQVCWGEFGDPETEIAICSACHVEYTTEPF